MNEDFIHDETVDNNTSNTDFDNETTELTDKKGGFVSILLKIIVGIFKFFEEVNEVSANKNDSTLSKITEALKQGRDLSA